MTRSSLSSNPSPLPVFSKEHARDCGTHSISSMHLEEAGTNAETCGSADPGRSRQTHRSGHSQAGVLFPLLRCCADGKPGSSHLLLSAHHAHERQKARQGLVWPCMHDAAGVGTDLEVPTAARRSWDSACVDYHTALSERFDTAMS